MMFDRSPSIISNRRRIGGITNISVESRPERALTLGGQPVGITQPAYHNVSIDMVVKDFRHDKNGNIVLTPLDDINFEHTQRELVHLLHDLGVFDLPKVRALIRMSGESEVFYDYLDKLGIAPTQE